MPIKLPLTQLTIAGLIGGAAAITTSSTPDIKRTDFSTVKRATALAYDATLAPASRAEIKEFVIPISDDTIEIQVATPRAFTTVNH